LSQLWVGIDVVQLAKQLLFGVEITRCPIAADAHADGARAASLSLRLPDRVKNAPLHPVQRSIRSAEMREFDGYRVLGVGVLTAVALENQLHLDVAALPLLEMDDGRSRAQVIAGIAAGDGIDRVRPQFAAA